MPTNDSRIFYDLTHAQCASATTTTEGGNQSVVAELEPSLRYVNFQFQGISVV